MATYAVKGYFLLIKQIHLSKNNYFIFKPNRLNVCLGSNQFYNIIIIII